MRRGEWNPLLLGLIVAAVLILVVILIVSRGGESGGGLVKGLFALVGIE